MPNCGCTETAVHAVNQPVYIEPAEIGATATRHYGALQEVAGAWVGRCGHRGNPIVTGIERATQTGDSWCPSRSHSCRRGAGGMERAPSSRHAWRAGRPAWRARQPPFEITDCSCVQRLIFPGSGLFPHNRPYRQAAMLRNPGIAGADVRERFPVFTVRTPELADNPDRSAC